MQAESDSEPLIDRYYGLMLGFFLHLARLEVPAHIYTSHRTRINEVMREFDIDLELPASHDDFCAQFASLSQSMMLALKGYSREAADFFAFGYYALQILVGPNDGDRTQETVRNDFNDIVAHYKLNADAIRGLIESGWDDSHVDDALWTELVGRFYRLTTFAIWPLKKQEAICFVIMPFTEPFSGYYFDFYRPALWRAGYRSIRAWVGLTNELYLTLLATLISRCDVSLADVSAQPGTTHPNLNVIHEIGLNMGLENRTLIIRNQDPVTLPSNFTGLPIVQYDTSPPDFPRLEVLTLVANLEQIGARSG